MQKLKKNDANDCAIESIVGIWQLLERIADFDGRDNDSWMEDVLQIACQMVFDKKELASSKETPPENKNSKK